MTFKSIIEKKCAVCGEISEFWTLHITIVNGYSDLDFRPAAMARYNLEYKVQCCLFCGYCAANISNAHSSTAEIIKRTEYQDLLKNPHLPALASKFICAGKIIEIQEPVAGYYDYHRAAWVCDDSNHTKGMIFCRKLAIDQLKKCHSQGQLVSEKPAYDDLILADLLRRADCCEEAIKIIDQGLLKQAEPIIIKALKYEHILCEKHDLSCYSFKVVAGN
jgi:hypothetical protein